MSFQSQSTTANSFVVGSCCNHFINRNVGSQYNAYNAVGWERNTRAMARPRSVKMQSLLDPLLLAVHKVRYYSRLFLQRPQSIRRVNQVGSWSIRTSIPVAPCMICVNQHNASIPRRMIAATDVMFLYLLAFPLLFVSLSSIVAVAGR